MKSAAEDWSEQEIFTRSPDETFEVGQRIGETLQVGAVILLTGELGAGKTVLAKGLAAGLGIDESDVTSPSFTLINEHQGRLQLFHIDLYRIESTATQGLGLEEILDHQNAVVVIEWAERLGFKPSGAIEIEMTYISDAQRRIVVRKHA